MLDIARDPGVVEAGVACGLRRQGGDVVEPRKSGCEQTGFDRREQLSDPCLRRIRPLRLGNQIDLSPVEPIRDHLCSEPVLGEPGDRRPGGFGQRLVLFRARNASVDQLGPFRSDDVHLRSTVETEVQDARAGGSGPERPVDVVDVCTADDADVEAARTERFDE